MARELLIFRHGQAVSSTETDDFARPITDKGKRAAQRMGVWLWQKGIRPDYIVCSPAERAWQSAQKLSKAMGRDASAITSDRRLYNADLKALLTVLAECPKKKDRIMLVGHNPGLTDLLLYLLGGETPQPDDAVLLPTAALARLQMPDSWKRLEFGSGRLKALTRPGDLPKKFPFPAPDGREKRDRPAYYYRQSAVIPYRMQKNRMQIMLIGSSKRNHWVVPKGIHEPGLSAQKSAAREAFEEAGIRGTVSKSMLGKYEYAKWGATCEVAVYAMRVSEILPEAIALIKEPTLRPMIGSLLDFIEKEG